MIKMALTIKVPIEAMATPEVDALSHSFRSMGGSNKMINGEIHFPFDNAGESYFSPEAYALCNAFELKCEGGMFYHVFTELEIDNLVPVDWPYSKDAEGIRVSLEDYFRKDTQYDLGDGMYLFRIVRTGVALTDADRLVYQDDLGTLLVKSEGLALMPQVVED